MRLRAATEADTEGVLTIYAPIVRETAISFEWDAPDAAEMKRRIQTIGAVYPWILRRGGWQAAIGGIALPNPASVALHESLGFRQTAHLPRVGFKFGRWHDLGFWRLDLEPGPTAPQPAAPPSLARSVS